ncbi:MAG: Glu-tRNA(Gln) amidotransferase subunit GatE, partial [candidate division Zixibacteria bacterium]|nr:Glu-tRNA(Gln) amidotransferase subunit GatE [candidate division Zixibacteria bacterium]
MAEDVTKLGFKCGVEIHQQLLTEKKLFCRCPTFKYSTHHDAEVLRHMRPTLSEMGGYDGCALMEFKTKKEIVYLLNKESVCTYEMDDTPPFPINQDALDIVIEIALMLGCSIVDEMHIARKQYLDGSIPTGFQRTGIVGINGKLPFKGREIGIRQISIEEESCREVADERHTIRFRTDRLGIPLIEVVTEPDMTTPEEASEVVRRIGRLMRATGKVKTGIGSVRQDVNVSIEGSGRVEIKGVPRYQLIPDLTRTEALRHKALLEIKSELAKRNITKENLQTYEEDLTNFMQGTEDSILKQAIENGWHIRGIKLEGCEGILTQHTQPGKVFASEIAGRVRVIACLDQNPNLYHTDVYPEYTGSHIDFKKIKHHLQMKGDDVGVIVWGPQADTITAAQEIRLRMEDAIAGVPNETRQHRHGG